MNISLRVKLPLDRGLILLSFFLFCFKLTYMIYEDTFRFGGIKRCIYWIRLWVTKMLCD